jgi:threonine dehydrogenase-like Zn-dependent dehydrogenase
MKATLMYGAGDVRIENVPDARLLLPTDALVRVTRSAICGSDLWPYRDMEKTDSGCAKGHEFIGIVESVGREVRRIKPGDFVIAPFAFSDGSCAFCHDGLPTSCMHGGFFGIGMDGVGGGQAEAVRVPLADGTLFVLPGSNGNDIMPSILTLTDVMGTGHHAAITARVGPGKTVGILGDGAVGLCGVIAAKRLGAEQIIIMGRHADRIALAKKFGATDVVSERGAEAADRIKGLTGGHGVHAVLECVGSLDSMRTALEIVRPGGAIGRVGVPHYDAIPDSEQSFYRNVTISGGPAPVREYIDELLPDILEGKIQPGHVFDHVTTIDGVPDGYRAMHERKAIKAMITF